MTPSCTTPLLSKPEFYLQLHTHYSHHYDTHAGLTGSRLSSVAHTSFTDTPQADAVTGTAWHSLSRSTSVGTWKHSLLHSHPQSCSWCEHEHWKPPHGTQQPFRQFLSVSSVKLEDVFKKPQFHRYSKVLQECFISAKHSSWTSANFNFYFCLYKSVWGFIFCFVTQ